MSASAAVQTTAERGTDFAALGMKITLLRQSTRTGNRWSRLGRCCTAGRRLAIGRRGPPRRPARGRDHRHDRVDTRWDLSRRLWQYQLAGPDDPHSATEYGARLRIRRLAYRGSPVPVTCRADWACRRLSDQQLRAVDQMLRGRATRTGATRQTPILTPSTPGPAGIPSAAQAPVGRRG
jgi:hypothetical protein